MEGFEHHVGADADAGAALLMLDIAVSREKNDSCVQVLLCMHHAMLGRHLIIAAVSCFVMQSAKSTLEQLKQTCEGAAKRHAQTKTELLSLQQQVRRGCGTSLQHAGLLMQLTLDHCACSTSIFKALPTL
jgi:hypothetical protein